MILKSRGQHRRKGDAGGSGNVRRGGEVGEGGRQGVTGSRESGRDE
jgi:hypothetical protein